VEVVVGISPETGYTFEMPIYLAAEFWATKIKAVPPACTKVTPAQQNLSIATKAMNCPGYSIVNVYTACEDVVDHVVRDVPRAHGLTGDKLNQYLTVLYSGIAYIQGACRDMSCTEDAFTKANPTIKVTAGFDAGTFMPVEKPLMQAAEFWAGRLASGTPLYAPIKTPKTSKPKP